MKKYSLKIGKFGAYFHNEVMGHDMTLEEVLNVMNNPPNEVSPEVASEFIGDLRKSIEPLPKKEIKGHWSDPESLKE